MTRSITDLSNSNFYDHDNVVISRPSVKRAESEKSRVNAAIYVIFARADDLSRSEELKLSNVTR